VSSQPDLFDVPVVPGLAYRPEFVSADEERALVAGLETIDVRPFRFQGWLGKRRVASFGWRYDFEGGGLGQAAAIPDFLLPLRARAASLAGLAADDLAHVLLTRYDPGAGIGWHRDRPQFERVVGVSLLSSCTLRFRRRRPAGFERATIELAPRSAYLLAGEARHGWEHGIAPMAALRWSITFRSLSEKGLRELTRSPGVLPSGGVPDTE